MFSFPLKTRRIAASAVATTKRKTIETYVHCFGFTRFVIVRPTPEGFNFNLQDGLAAILGSKVSQPRTKENKMPKKQPSEFNYLSNDPDYAPSPEIEEFMEEEILRAPKDPELLAHRLRNNTSASPRDSGGDLDASWEDVNESGSESVAGDNPTPDQSLVEENANAVGVNFEDNEELEFIDKIERRDRDRFELDQRSKATEDMI